MIRRLFSTTVGKTININWKKKDGSIVPSVARVGDTLLKVAHRNGIEMEGACEGVCACSTCHVILEENIFDNLPEPTEKEDDMLDLAFGLSATSRLGCQVVVEESHHDMIVSLPQATRNFYVVSF